MHFPEFRRGGVHARIGSLGRSLRSSSISNSKQPSLQDRIVNQIQINNLIELQPAGLRFPMHLYEARPRKDKRGVDLISDALPFARLLYAGPDAASRSAAFPLRIATA
jgi:hypothetical protein